MPETSTIRKFIAAVQTGRTNTTKALEMLFTNPGRHRTHTNFGDLSVAGALNKPLAAWAKAVLRALGLSDPELAHIEDWPDTEKEEVRKALVVAIQADRNVRFLWELHDVAGSDNRVTNVDGPGDITVTFRSPRANVRLTSTVNLGEIIVDV